MNKPNRNTPQYLPSRFNQGLTPLSVIKPRQPAAPPPAEMTWTCPKCGLIEPRRLPTGRYMKRLCPCKQKARREEIEAEQARAWQKEQIYRMFGGWLGKVWADKKVIARMANKTFDNYNAEAFPEAFQDARDFCEEMPEDSNIIFTGDFGTGKSHLSAAILNYCMMQHGVTGLYIEAPTLFKIYQATARMFDQTEHLIFVDQFISNPLVCIDDVDKAAPDKDRLEAYYLLLNARYQAGRATIISTNREDPASYLGDAVMSRLSSGLTTVEMYGADYRQLGV
jgi:DNA replication protein DnaC